MSPTILDVAKKAKVSSGAASEIVNSGKIHKYSADTVERVKKAALALGYNVDHLAKSLRTRRTGIIGIGCISKLQLGSFYEPYITDIYQGLGDFFGPQNIRLIFQQYQSEYANVDTFELASSRIVDGFIFILHATEVASFIRDHQKNPAKLNVPFVVIHSLHTPLKFPSVGLDCVKGGSLATRHLLEHGYQTIGCVMPGENQPHCRNILAGYRQEMEKRHKTVRVLDAQSFGTQCGYEFAAGLLAKQADLPRALVVTDDSLAYGMIQKFSQAGVRVPDDIALIGFGDSLNQFFVATELTTIRQPGREKGRAAGELLLGLLNPNGGPAKSQTIIMEPTLTVRRSCGCNGK